MRSDKDSSQYINTDRVVNIERRGMQNEIGRAMCSQIEVALRPRVQRTRIVTVTTQMSNPHM